MSETTENLESYHRELLTKAQRIVIKVGTHVIVNENGNPNKRRITHIVKDIAALRKLGKQVILVTSGSIGIGLHKLGLKSRPKTLPELQMAAAVGQPRLQSLYYDLFADEKCLTSQVLLTAGDLKHRQRHLNARNTLLKLLDNNIVPIINENDAVSVDEIKFGDNDVLSALVSSLVDAELLILLSTVNGLQDTKSTKAAKRISYLEHISQQEYALVEKKSNNLSTGGMNSKLSAAQLAHKLGAQVVIADGRQKETCISICQGKSIGTLIGNLHKITPIISRKRWIAFFQRPQGTLTIDEGAETALMTKGKSLLAVGVKAVQGKFSNGAVVAITNLQRDLLAHGLCNYSSEDLNKIIGLKNSDIFKLTEIENYNSVIHRDNLLIMEPL